MLDDKQLVDICARLYDDRSDWDDLLWPEADDGVCVALQRVKDIDVVVFRGSVTLEDWVRDFFAVPHATINHPLLGDVHAGFMLGMDAAFDHVFPLLRSSVIVIGHSLGAGRAKLFSGLMVASGRVPMGCVVWGEPRSGCGKLKQLVSVIGSRRSYRNVGNNGLHDYVTDVPSDPPFCHDTPFTDHFVTPDPNDSWGMFRYHHISLYAQVSPAPAIAA